MKILFAASEASPFVKTGGLGDVVGSLPKALKQQGCEARIILPDYASIPETYKQAMTELGQFKVHLSWRKQCCSLKYLELDGLSFYFIHNDYYFSRNGTYGFYDDAERYAFFSKAIIELLPHLDFSPDILHCNDWHTGLAAIYLKEYQQLNPEYRSIKTVFTIHNLLYQGVFNKAVLGDVFGLSEKYLSIDGLEFYGQVNCLKGGLLFSDTITTVSHTYAEEIQTAQYGERLDGVIRAQSKQLSGILNGIDFDDFNPMTDKELYLNYKDDLNAKKYNKAALQKELGLPEKLDSPLFVIVSRLVAQKGLDYIAAVLEALMQKDIQFVVLGNGEEKYQNMFYEVQQRYPEKAKALICFDERLARKLYAAGDFLLMPSVFEPCGVSQMIAMRYGCIPIVRATGGLKDTVVDFDEHSFQGNGLVFKSDQDFLSTISKAYRLYQCDVSWRNLVRNALDTDFSWQKSAREYLMLYNKLKEVNNVF